MIISASRRTDIPAFYSEWFMNRVRAGFLLSRNPFNAHQIKRISLLRKDVEVIVFWTRNPYHLMPYLQELDKKGYLYYFQYTITGYPRILEKSVPNTYKAIETFIELSSKIGSDRVIWRYDPILLSNLLPIDEHKRIFYKIAKALAGKTKRVVVSFSDFYKKTERNLNGIEGLIYSDITKDGNALLDLSRYMQAVSSEFGMEIQSCAETVDLSCAEVSHGKCVDDQLINKIFGVDVNRVKDKNQREACGCVKSFDIGVYNTCLHGCSYCYATFSNDIVTKNKQKHDPDSPFLIGGIDGVDPMLLIEAGAQGTLF